MEIEMLLINSLVIEINLKALYCVDYLVYGVSVKDESSARVPTAFGCSPVASDVVVAEPYHMRNAIMCN